jgi:RNA polymerase sigma factor (sigma-70 family)
MISRNCTYIPSQLESENFLIAQAVQGDADAFDKIVDIYQLQLLNFIRRCLNDEELSNDVLQFVFMQLHVSLPKLHRNLHSTRTKNPLKSWLFQVAWNRCMDELRRHRSIPFSSLETFDQDEELSMLNVIPDPHPLPEAVAENHELRKTVRQAIEKLPPRLRSVVFLRYTRELSFVEIGRILHMPENTAKTYFQRARPLLRAELTPYVAAR